jgi:dihydrofolate reductase
VRDVVVYQLLSLDGVAEEPSDWLFDDGPEVFANLSRVIESQTDVLLGRATYEYWSGYWPSSDVEPFASFINSTPKHIFTSSPFTVDWANTVAVTTSAVDYVRALKVQTGGDVGIHGSTRLARSLLRADLVDRLELVVAPSIAGRGARLFDADDQLRRLSLERLERTPAGSLLLTYQLPSA